MRGYGRFRAKLFTGRQEETFILGRSGRRPANLSVRAAAVGQQGHRYRNNAKVYNLHFTLNRAILLKWL
jgi:hypothetical protein